MECGEADVAFERILLPANLDQFYGDLLLKGQDLRREKSIKAEEAALFTDKCGVLIQGRSAEQGLAALLHREGGSGR